MNREFEETLITKYPKILAGYVGVAPWYKEHFRCQDGWSHLLEPLFNQLQYEADSESNNRGQVVVQEIKEKFGKLKIVPFHAGEYHRGMIRFIEAISSRICEVCGKPGQLYLEAPAVTRCNEHYQPGIRRIGTEETPPRVEKNHKEMTAYLYGTYPKLFAQRHSSIQYSCMPWGFSCYEGWFDVIDVLCEEIQAEVDSRGIHQVEASQVKEKYGSLSFYYRGGNSTIDGMVLMAELLSGHLCEVCGAPGSNLVRNRWYATRCEVHRLKEES